MADKIYVIDTNIILHNPQGIKQLSQDNNNIGDISTICRRILFVTKIRTQYRVRFTKYERKK